MTEEDAKRWKTFSQILLVIALVFSATAVWRIATCQGPCEQMFADLAIKLPLLTRVCLSPFYVAILPVLAILSILKEFLLKDGRVRFVLSATYLVLVVLVREMFVQGTFTLMKELGG